MIKKVLAASFLSLALIFLAVEIIHIYSKPQTRELKEKEEITPTSIPTITIEGPHSSNIPTITVAPTKVLTPSPTKISTKPTTTPTPTKVVRGTIKIMPLGDSITDGVFSPGGYRTYLWSMLMQNGYNVDLVGSLANGTSELGDWNHEGHIGWEAGQLAGSAGALVAAYQPDIILIHVGTNDLDHGASGEVITGRLSSLLGTIFASKPDAYVIVSTIVTSRGDKAAWANYNGAIPGLVSIYQGQGRSISYVDMSQALTEADLYDGIHPNVNGFIKMAARWYPAVTSAYSQFAR